jgi:hypothetical protein
MLKTQVTFLPLPKKSFLQIDSNPELIDSSNYGIFEYSQEPQLKYTKKFYPKTYPVQNSPKNKPEHWTQ